MGSRRPRTETSVGLFDNAAARAATALVAVQAGRVADGARAEFWPAVAYLVRVVEAAVAVDAGDDAALPPKTPVAGAVRIGEVGT